MSTSDLFKWSDAYRIDILEVDEQHKELVGLINQLHVAVLQQHGKAALRAILDRLNNSTRTHFLLEESLMRLTHYPALEIHKQQHQDLLAQGQALQQQLENINKTINFELLQSLNNWLVEHIEQSDRHFSAHFQQADLLQHAASTSQVKQVAKKRWWKFW